jgi:PAS domain S-box-containing protein
MRIEGSHRFVWTSAAVAAAVLVVTIGYLAVQRSAERLFEDSCISQLRGSIHMLAARVRGEADELARALQTTALSCPSREAAAAGAYGADLDRLRRLEPRLFVAAMLFDRGGRLLAAEPPGLPQGDDLVAAEEAGRRAVRGAGQGANAVFSVVRRGGTVVAVAGVAGVPQAGVGAAGVWVDAGRLAAALLDNVLSEGHGYAFLASNDGTLLAISGGGRTRSLATLADAVGPDWGRALSRPLPEVGAGRWWWPQGAGVRREAMLWVLEPVTAAGARWVVGGAVPQRWATRGDRPLVFGGVALLAVLAAGVVAALAAWKRANAERQAAVREAERWQGLAQRRMRETRWRGLADHAGSPVVCLAGHRVAGANLRAAQELGRDGSDSLVGCDFLTFVVAADHDRIAAYLDDRRLQGGGSATVVARLVTSDGRTFEAEVTATSVHEFDEAIVYVSWQGLQLRHRAEAVLEAIAAAAPLVLVVTDTSGNLAWANAALAERTGYDPRRFQGRPLLPIVEASHRRVVVSALAKARRGIPNGGQARIRREDGDVLTVEFKAFPVRSGPDPTGVLFVASEVGGQRHDGRDFPAAARDRALSQLGTSLAHKISNNFQALMGILDELEAAAPVPGALDVAQRLVAGAVEDLRRFVAVSRSGSGALRPVRLGPVIERWLEKAAPALPATVRLTSRREVEDDRVLADAAQVVLWLEVSLAAALGGMELGGAVEVSLREGSAPGSVRVVFSDTGATALGSGAEGEDDREHFASRRTARALADLIAMRHGGRSGGMLVGGVGGRSWLELPTRSTAAAAEEEAPRRRRAGAVLVADDEEMVRTPLATALRAAGHEVVEAANGLETVEKVLAAPERFALVVLDLVMPVMDGREALRRLRAGAPGVPVVICTGYDPAGDDVLAAAGLLIKPFSLDEFLAKVSELTGTGGAGATVVP